MKIILLIPVFLISYFPAWGQTNLILPDYRRILAFDYENDLFTGTDRYYSQGIDWSYSFLNDRAKIRQFRTKPVCSGFSAVLKHDVYTPSTIRKDSALFNDHPYAALFCGRINYLLIDTLHGFSFSAGLEIGGTGPFARGKEMQTAIHKATNNPVPQGWEYQISNGLIFDALFSAEKSIVKWKNLVRAIVKTDVRLGVFQTHLKPSATIMLGSLERYKLFFYSTGSVTFVGHDGSLQGSLVGKTSPVTVAGSGLNRVVVEGESGLRFQTKCFGASIHYSVQSPTFRSQQFGTHAWGGVGLFFRF